MRTGLLLTILAVSLSATGGAEPGRALKPGDVVTNSIGMKLAWIPPGSFTMGSPESERGRTANETPRTVTVAQGFRLGVTEVTQKQWREIMGSDPSYFKGDQLPVEHVTWHEAAEFCRRLGEKEGRHYRLPTEAEWEYACRAGSTAAYSTGKDEAALAEAGWYQRNSGNQSHPVGQKKPNAWGLHDMHGNVSEWCADRPDGAVSSPDSQILSREIKAERDHRGGSWGLSAGDCRSASRHRNDGNFRYFDLGFRVVRESE